MGFITSTVAYGREAHGVVFAESKCILKGQSDGREEAYFRSDEGVPQGLVVGSDGSGDWAQVGQGRASITRKSS